MLQLTLLLLAVLLLAENGQACTRSQRQPGSGGVSVGNPNNPPNAPPTPNPTPPPPPTALPKGWLEPPEDDGQLAQDMSRSNCRKAVRFAVVQEDGSSTATQEDIQEVWEYTCEFRVCSEVDFTGDSGECACAMFATNTGGNTYADQDYLEYSTSVDYFYMVVWNTQTREVVERIPGWDFDPNSEVAEDLAAAAAGDMMYAKQLNAFTGQIANSTLPASLDDTPANQHHVPAACFIVTQKYTTTTRWPYTPLPIMYSDPSLWATDCVPVYDNDPENGLSNGAPVAAAKRQEIGEIDPETPKQRFFRRTFLLFAMTDDAAAQNAHIPAGAVTEHRMLEAYYFSSTCKAVASKFTIDRRFTQTIERETHHNILGAFAWTRTYGKSFFVGGAPRGFSAPASFWATGYHRVNWLEPYSKRNGNAEFRPNVLRASLLGDCTDYAGDTANEAYIGCEADKVYKICNTLPESWKTCTPNSEGCSIGSQTNQFGETALFYEIDSSVDCPGFVDTSCAVESTFLSFQNFGDLARDYEKRPDSWLLTGVRTTDCSYPQLAEFDSIPFKAVGVGAQLRKRASLGKSFATKIHYNERNNVHALTNTEDENAFSPFDTTVGQGGLEMDLGFRVALGSTQNGKPDGDHPLELFPEQYAAPVSLDPNDPTQLGGYTALALQWDGQAPPCIKGTQGCACRVAGETNRPDCDAPLACQSLDGGSFCVVPDCPIGSSGCECKADSSCSEDHLTCSGNTCVFGTVCVAGTAGCAATAEGNCEDGSFIEYTSNGLVCAYRNCLPGSAGCDCTEDQVEECAGGICTASRMCLGQGIADNTFGGACDATAENPCELGFQCKLGVCVPNTCAPGESGCTCKAGACDEADAICGDDLRCMKKSCQPGTPGCGCSLGQCSEGFECDFSEFKDAGRCIEERCDAGSPGCPCLSDGSCNEKTFSCLSLNKAGDDNRCMSNGVDCVTPRDDLCRAYCGEGRVKTCHPCAGTTPECIEGSASSIVAFSAVVLAVVATLL